MPSSTHMHPLRLLVLSLFPALALSCAARQTPPTPGVASPTTRPDFAGHDTSTEDTVSPPDNATVVAEARPETRVIPPLFFGMQMHSLMSNEKHHRLSAQTAAGLGARFVRDECFWHEVEKQKGRYRIPDVPLENLRINKSNGLETLVILDYTNDHYDDGHAPTSPEAIEAFGRYCFHMASELKDICRYFEIWNEPNTDGFWRPRKDAKAYARLFETAAREVHRANPEAVVFGATLSGIDGEFMALMCAETDCSKMDVLSIHPYCTPRSPGQADIFQQMNNLRLQAFPDTQTRRPIWVTEIGYPTNLQGGVSEWRQAEAIAQTYLLGAARPELQGVVWYWMGPDGPDALWAEDRFGVIRPEFKGRKPAAFPYDVLAHLLPGMTVATTVQQIPHIPDSRVIRMHDPKGRHYTAVYVEEGEYSIDLMDHDSAEVIPLTAATPRSLAASPAGPIQVNISPMPVLIMTDQPLKLRKSKRAQFLFARSPEIPRGGEERILAASRQNVKGEGFKAHLLWPGRLETERIPAPLPWDVQDLKEGDAAALALHVGSDERPQSAPLAAYWFAPGADKPSSRLSRTLSVSDPLALDIRGVISPSAKPVAAITVKNLTERPADVELRVRVEGRNEKTFSIEALGPEAVKLVTVPIGSLPSPDAVLEIAAAARAGDGVEVSIKNYASFMASPRLPRAPVIDGDLSDWTIPFPPIFLGRRNQIVAERHAWGGPDDASARVWTGWDDHWFYVGAEFIDDLHVEEATGFTVYNNDGLEIYFDTDRENGRAQETYGEKQFQYGLFPSQGQDVCYDFQHLQAPSPGARIKINRTPAAAQFHPADDAPTSASMIIEAAIPLAELQLEPKPGLEIGFSIALNDDDSPNYIYPFSQDLQMQWSRQRNAWQRPAAFCSLWLARLPDKPKNPSN